MKLTEDETKLINHARSALASKNKMRWKCLFMSIFLFSFCGLVAWMLLSKIDTILYIEVTKGFAVGTIFALIIVSSGVMGVIYLVQFIRGVSDFKMEELLLKYHDENQKND